MTLDPVVVAAIVALAVMCAGSGILLLRPRGAPPAGALLVLSALVFGGGLALANADAPDRLVAAAFTAGALLTFPLAVATYPRARARDPVDFVCLATIAAAGTVATGTQDVDARGAMGIVGIVTLLSHLWWRLERGPIAERGPLLWLTLALGTGGLAAGFAAFVGDQNAETPATGAAIGVLFLTAVGPAMVLGLRRPDVVDVRGLLVHAVVIGVTVLLYLSVFVGIVSILQVLNDDRTPKVATLGLIGAGCALAVRPTMVVLRGVIDQLLFGDRPDPLRAATHVVDRIGDDPVLALQAIREALVLPYASLRADGAELAASGTAVTHTRTLPLPLGGDSVGEIVVGLRAGDLGLAAGDEHVLRIVAPLLAQTIRARALARDLQASRGEAIAAIEEERRRLRRDLHDGLGPTLTGVAFATDAARNKLRTDPAAADELLARLRADTSDAIAEIRRLVEGLRPPALDELGLVAAVRQQAKHMYTAAGAPLDVSIEAPEPMPELPAAAEVAAYRIVVEALTNVARHSASPSAHVTLTLDLEALDITIDDAGATGAPWRPGVGMSSMRERAEQVGGILDAGARPTGGRVRATIPLG